MKKLVLLSALMLVSILCFLSTTVNAKIWRVNNRTGMAADFITAQSAHNGATAGDTLYFEPSAVLYGDLTCTKKLILVGPGYFLCENPETQALTTSASLGSVIFTSSGGPASENSKIMGLDLVSVTIEVSNIVVERNLIHNDVVVNAGVVSNILVCQNYIGGSVFTQATTAPPCTVNNFMVKNNMITYLYSFPESYFTIENNIIWNGFINVQNATIQNNILIYGTFYPNNNSYSYNIATDNAFGNQNGNQEFIDPDNMFNCYSSCLEFSSDGRWMLKPGSPAIGTGAGGTDCGIFGGANPYVLSGLPAIPAIYYFSHSNTNSQINVNLKVKSHN
ncbi:MAG: hypothetical protein M0Q38_09125 [Bacteroidales bacterium]|jgi:hypothetical protein|nr:hypothetical protein [Bacteroidales bacterium]